MESLTARASFVLHCMQLIFTCAGLRECEAPSQWCIGSKDLPQFFPCSTRGRLPHPSNMTLYLHCKGPGYQACVCTCQYEDMCYDRDTRTCKFTYLDPDANCGSLVIPISQRHGGGHNENVGSDVTPTTNFKDVHRRQKPTSPPWMRYPPKQKHDNSHKGSWHYPHKHRNISKSGDEHGKLNEHNEVIERHGNTIYVTNTGSPSDARNDALAVKETSKPFRLTVIEDDSMFPAWAIALVVLCVVIIVMLIVLILY